MRILHEEYAHPTQASVVALSVFGQPGDGYLVAESRRGTSTVVSTLGLFDGREAAVARARSRAAELTHQRYRKLEAAS